MAPERYMSYIMSLFSFLESVSFPLHRSDQHNSSLNSVSDEEVDTVSGWGLGTENQLSLRGQLMVMQQTVTCDCDPVDSSHFTSGKIKIIAPESKSNGQANFPLWQSEHNISVHAKSSICWQMAFR